MEGVLSVLGKSVHVFGSHHVFLMDYSLVKTLVHKWQHNRDPDSLRVEEIAKSISQGGFPPIVLSVAELDSKLVVYDGNHRREAMNRCEYSGKVLLDVVFHAQPADVIRLFQNLNKAVHVSDLYMEPEQTTNVRLEITELVKELETKYKPFVSASNRCNAPNFNRDSLIDFVFHVFSDHKYPVSQIQAGLEKLNEMYKQDMYGRGLLRAGVLQKCAKYDFWLFRNRVIPIEDLITAMGH
jgi:hypothetical protein